MKDHPLDIPDYGDSFVSTNFDRRTIGYSEPSRLEIYTAREANKALGAMCAGNATQKHDIALNLVHTIEVLERRAVYLEGFLESLRVLLMRFNLT